jgi:Trypsin-like peptidase domain
MVEQEPQRTRAILKTHFHKRNDGKWAIDALKSIPLKPRDGSADDDFFSIEDDLVVDRPSLLGTIRSVLGQSIVPIVAQVPGEPVLRCLGTGFFISCSGFLITAAHVITAPIEKQYGSVTELDNRTWNFGSLVLGVMIPLNPVLQGSGYFFRDIEWATFLATRAEDPLPIRGVDLKLTSDTAICKVSPIAEGVPHQPLAIVQPGLVGTGMAVGKSATAIGYGEMRNVELQQHSQSVVSGDFSFGLHASTGAILERFPDNMTKRQVPTPGACFSAALRLPAGMSGSPIFDDEGIYVHGVVSKGWVDESGPARFGYGSMLAPSMGLRIEPLDNKTLRELSESDDHGFPQLRGPGI